MPKKAQKYFATTLYAALGLLIANNLVNLAGGNIRALLPLTVQVFVLAVIYFDPAWSYIFVKIWALFGVFAGLAMWLAVALDGPEHFGSLSDAIFNSIVFVASLYFFKFAKTSLSDEQKQI